MRVLRYRLLPLAEAARTDSGRTPSPGKGRAGNKDAGTRMFFKSGKEKPVWDAILTAGTVGLHLVTATFVGAAMGYFLDDWLGTKPWLFLFMLVMGIIAGFRMVIQDVQRIQRADKKDHPAHWDDKDKDDRA